MFLSVLNRAAETERKKKQLEEQFKAAEKAARLTQPPEEEELKPLSAKAETAWRSQVNYDRKALVARLSDKDLFDLTGVSDEPSWARWRENPLTMPPDASARIDRLGFEQSLYRPRVEEERDNPLWRHLAYRLKDNLAHVWAGLEDWESLRTGGGGPAWKMMFGDTAVPDPTLAPRMPGYPILVDPQDQADYLKRYGVVGALTNVWIDFVKHKVVAPSLGQGAMAASALLGLDTPLSDDIRRRMDNGLTFLEAAEEAYDEGKLPKGVAGTLEFILDPINFIPALGILKVAARIGTKTVLGAPKAAGLVGTILSESDFARYVVGVPELAVEEKLWYQKTLQSVTKQLEKQGVKVGRAELPVAEAVAKAPSTAVPAGAAAPKAAKVTLYRGEPVGVRPPGMVGMRGTDIPFSVRKEIAENFAGKSGRVVEIEVTPEQLASFNKQSFTGAGGIDETSYFVPQGVYETARPVVPKAAKAVEVTEAVIVPETVTAAKATKPRLRRLPDPLGIIDALAPTTRETWARPSATEPWNVKLGAVPDVVDWVVGMPLRGASKIAKLVDPGLTAKTGSVGAIQVARTRIADSFNSIKTIGGAHMSAVKLFLQPDGAGFMGGGIRRKAGAKNIAVNKLAQPHWGDFVGTPADKLDEVFVGITDGQRLAHALYRPLQDELTQLKLTNELITAAELLDEPYFPRKISEAMQNKSFSDLAKIARGDAPTVGNPKAFQLPRKWMHLNDALRAGMDYVSDPVTLWNLQVNDIAKAYTDKLLGEMLKDQGLMIGTKELRAAMKQNRRIATLIPKAVRGDKDSLAELSRFGDPQLDEILHTPNNDALLQKLADYKLGVERGLEDAFDQLKAAETGTRLRVGGKLLAGQTAKDKQVAEGILDMIRGEQAAGRRTGKALSVLEESNNYLRQLRSTLDFSAPFIQGLPLLFLEPDVWAKATAKHFEAFIDPHATTRFFIDNAAKVRLFAEDGVVFGSSEFMAASQSKFLTGQWMPKNKWQSALKVGGRSVGEALSPFQRAFDTWGDSARFLAMDALRPLARMPDEIAATADFVNHLTGMFNSARLGVTPTQRSLESFALFSPRYFRAQLAILKDSFQGGLRGEQARYSLAKFAAFGLTSYVMIAKAMAQEPKLDPRPKSVGGDGADFMTWGMAGARWGPGSQWLSLTRVLGGIYADTVENPDGFLSLAALEKTYEDLTRFVRSKLGPVASGLATLYSGEDYIGESWERDNFMDSALKFFSMQAEDSAPFIVQDVFEGPPTVPYQQRLKRLGPSAAGARVYPERLSDTLEARQGELIRQEFGEDVTLEDLRAGRVEGVPLAARGELGVRRLTDSDPTAREYKRLYDEERKVRQSGDINERITLYFDEIESVQAKYDSDINDESAHYAGQGLLMEGVRYRDEMREIGQRKGAEIANVAGRYEDVAEELDKRSATSIVRRIKEGVFIGDLAYEAYIRAVVSKGDMPSEQGGYLLPDGSYDYEKRESTLKEIAQVFGKGELSPDAVLEYIDLRREYRDPSRPALHPLAADLEAARDILEPYWRIPERLFGQQPNWPGIKKMLSTQEPALIEALQDETGELRRVLMRIVDKEREFWRMDNPAGDAALADFWGGKPRTPEAEDLLMRRRRARALLTK